EKGGAALVSTAPTAKPPGDVDPAKVKEIQEETKKLMKDSETVAAFVWADVAGNPPTEAERKTALTKAFEGIKLGSNTPAVRSTLLDAHARLADKASLQSTLENSFS